MAVYAVGDIHGHYDEWIELKNRIERQDPSAMFILVGDIIDRGPKQKEMLDWALENITNDGKYQMILGNHEDMKLHLIYDVKENPDDYGDIIDNYGFLYDMYNKEVSPERVIEYLEWMRTLPLYKDIIVNNQRFIIVHGGISSPSVKDNKIMNTNSLNVRNDLLWNRDNKNYSGIKDAIIVHGHSATVFEEAFDLGFDILDDDYVDNLKGKIFNTNNKYNIDCGLVYKSKYHRNLAALNLNTLEEIYLYNYESEETNESGSLG